MRFYFSLVGTQVRTRNFLFFLCLFSPLFSLLTFGASVAHFYGDALLHCWSAKKRPFFYIALQQSIVTGLALLDTSLSPELANGNM